MRGNVVAALIIAVAFVLGLTILAVTWRGNVQIAQTLKVTGSARMDLVSDLGLLSFRVRGEGATAEEAWLDLERQRPVVMTFLATMGVADTDVEPFPISMQTLDEFDENNRRTGNTLKHLADQGFRIEHQDVQLIRNVSLDMGSLVTEGVRVQTSMPEYLYTGLAEIREEVQALAAEDAIRRAGKVAEAAGARLGPIRDARMGVLQVTPRHSTQVSDWGINDNSSIDKQITAVVHASFAIR
jgi:uncharacterized protein